MRRWMSVLPLIVALSACPAKSTFPVLDGANLPARGTTALRVLMAWPKPNGGLHTLADESYVDHVTFKLRSGTAPGGVDVATVQAKPPFNPAGISVNFPAVPDGTYYVRAAAFASTDDSFPISLPQPAGWTDSTNTVTLAGGNVSYSVGTGLALSVQLVDGGIQTITVTVNGPLALGYDAALVGPNNDILATYSSPNSLLPATFHFKQVDTGTYSVWASARLNATNVTLAKPSVTTVTVNKGVLTYPNSGTGLVVNTTNGTVPPRRWIPLNVPATQANIGGLESGKLSGNTLFFVQKFGAKIFKVDLTTGLLSLAAGNGTLNGSPSGSNALTASLGQLKNIATDRSGNLFFAGPGDVWEMPSTSGVYFGQPMMAGNIYQIGAGSCCPAMGSGDGGMATAAGFGEIRGLAFDSNGNVYLSDRNDSTIRKIDVTTGIISHVAGQSNQTGYSVDGSTATTLTLANSRLNNPWNLDFDVNGNLYVADQENHCVRKLDLVAQTITTIAGTPGSNGFSGDGGLATSAQLQEPIGVVCFGPHVFISDTNNSRVRIVAGANGNYGPQAIATGKIYTIAGNGGGWADGDGGPAVLAQVGNPGSLSVDGTGNLYITQGGQVRLVNATTGRISTVAGSNNAPNGSFPYLSSPVALAVDSSGNVYVADADSQRVQKVDSANNVTVVAGDGFGGFSGDGIAATASHLNFSSPGNSIPGGLVMAANGDLFIADTANHQIRRVHSGVITTLAGTGIAGFSGDGGQATGAQLSNPSGLALDTSNHLFVADAGNHRVRRIDLTSGVITTVAGTGVATNTGTGGVATGAALNVPVGVAVDRVGNLFIIETGGALGATGNNRLAFVPAQNGTYYGQANLVGGNLYRLVGDPGGATGSAGDGGPCTSASLNAPTGVCADRGGNVYIIDRGNNKIRLLAATGRIATVSGDGNQGYNLGTSLATAQFNQPYAITVDDAGTVYVADTGNRSVRTIN